MSTTLEAPVTVEAEYESLCEECQEKIAVGSQVARLNKRWVHAACWHTL